MNGIHIVYLDFSTIQRLLITGELMAAALDIDDVPGVAAPALARVWFETAETARREINEYPGRLS